MNLRPRCVRYNKTKPTKPWDAILHLNGQRKSLGRYATREEAEAACRDARKAVPTLPPGRPHIPPERRQVIRDTYYTTGSKEATARACGVNVKTVYRVLREGRPAQGVDAFPDMAVEPA
jgi:hypothetical protein